MSDIDRQIMSECEAENIDVTSVGVELKKAKGFFNRRKVLELFGSVANEQDHRAVQRIAERHAGDNYDLTDNLTVKR